MWLTHTFLIYVAQFTIRVFGPRSIPDLYGSPTILVYVAHPHDSLVVAHPRFLIYVVTHDS
jgi:hypothetical protein